MTPHTNPFYTINETIAVLRNLGAAPLSNPRGSAPPEAWREHIIGIQVNRVYDYNPNTHHFETVIHVNKVGFEMLHRLINVPYTLEKFTQANDKMVMRPSNLIEIIALSPAVQEDLGI